MEKTTFRVVFGVNLKYYGKRDLAAAGSSSCDRKK